MKCDTFHGAKSASSVKNSTLPISAILEGGGGGECDFSFYLLLFILPAISLYFWHCGDVRLLMQHNVS